MRLLPRKAEPPPSPPPPPRAIHRTLAEFAPLSAGEQALLAACRTGAIADLGPGCPEAADEARNVRADFVRFLALGGDEQAPVDEHGVQLSGAWLLGPLDLYGTRLTRQIDLVRCRVERVDASWAVMPSMSFAGCRIEKDFDADGLRCDGSLFINNGTHVAGGAFLAAATISGSFYCEGGSFANPAGPALNCEAAKIDGRVRLDSFQDAATQQQYLFEAKGEIVLNNAVIGGSLYLNGASLVAAGGNALSATGARIGGDLSLSHQVAVQGTVNLVGARIDGHLICHRASFSAPGADALTCESASVGRMFMFREIVGVDGTLNLWDMRVGTLSDDLASWDKATGRLILDGFTYGSLAEVSPQSPTAASSPPPSTDADERIGWLKLQRPGDLGRQFRPQPWEQLIKVLRAMGHANAARDVAIAKEYARGHAGKARSWKRPVRSAFHIAYGALAGFGYKPDRLFWCLVGACLAFAAFYGWAAHSCAGGPCPESLIVVAKPDAAGPRAFHPLLFSLDVLLPIDLGYAGNWRAADGGQGPLVAWAIVAETILGWLFAGLAVGALGNLIKRD